ncbi:MAG: Rieske 2Fe-2S domain-containing protein [Henriciella sp.]
MLTDTEQSLAAARPNQVDFDRVAGLHYLGNYVRRLPINLARMMENAYDWEHLPFVHSSSFSSIDLIDSGTWGWRAKIGLPEGAPASHQLLDLLVESDKHYWVSTVFSGPGTGIEIHTQATELAENEIEVDVRFYLPEAPENETGAEMILAYMQQQYATLYDEDLDLMSGRQEALDDRLRWAANAPDPKDILVGRTDDLDPDQVHVVEMEQGRFCVRQWQGRWLVHSAVCTHLLGPLENSSVDENGQVTCPWHGYHFDVQTGENTEQKCQALAQPPELITVNETLYLRPA